MVIEVLGITSSFGNSVGAQDPGRDNARTQNVSQSFPDSWKLTSELM